MDRQIHSVPWGTDITIGVGQEIENMGKRRSKDVSKKGGDDGSMNETFNLDEEEEEGEEDVISLASVYRQVHSHLILRNEAENGQNFIFSRVKSCSFPLIAGTLPCTLLHTDSSGPSAAESFT